jgi:RecA/RadA recombinase
MEDDVEVVRAAVNEPRPRRPQVAPGDFLSSGVHLINLAISGRANGGYPKGKYFYLVGDTESGKTFLTLSALAEAANNRHFDGYKLVYNGPEGGDQFDTVHFFGERLLKRIQHVCTPTVEEFYFNLYDTLKASPTVYVLDSMDSLDSRDDEAKFLEAKAAHHNGRKVTGSYGMGKARRNSQDVKRVTYLLRSTKSILLVISQTRDKVNSGLPFPTKTRAGGRALSFYADCEVWTSVRKRLKKKVGIKDRVIGSILKVAVEKNRTGYGWHGSVLVPFFPSHGLDDTGASVKYLLEEGHWKKGSGGVTAPEFTFKGSEEKLIAHIEAEDGERALHLLAQKVWNGVQDGCAVPRKRRYH